MSAHGLIQIMFPTNTNQRRRKQWASYHSYSLRDLFNHMSQCPAESGKLIGKCFNVLVSQQTHVQTHIHSNT